MFVRQLYDYASESLFVNEFVGVEHSQISDLFRSNPIICMYLWQKKIYAVDRCNQLWPCQQAQQAPPPPPPWWAWQLRFCSALICVKKTRLSRKCRCYGDAVRLQCTTNTTRTILGGHATGDWLAIQSSTPNARPIRSYAKTYDTRAHRRKVAVGLTDQTDGDSQAVPMHDATHAPCVCVCRACVRCAHKRTYGAARITLRSYGDRKRGESRSRRRFEWCVESLACACVANSDRQVSSSARKLVIWLAWIPKHTSTTLWDCDAFVADCLLSMYYSCRRARFLGRKGTQWLELRCYVPIVGKNSIVSLDRLQTLFTAFAGNCRISTPSSGGVQMISHCNIVFF